MGDGVREKRQVFLILGGVAASLLNFRGRLLQDMVSRGHEVHACAPVFSADEVNRLAEIGVEAHTVDLRRTGVDPRDDIGYLLGIFRLCRRLRVDSCLGYTVKPVIFGLLGARMAGVKRRFALITGLGYAFGSSKRNSGILETLVGMLYRVSLSGCHHVFFQNRDDRKLFLERGLVPRRVPATVVNGSGVDLEHFGKAEPPPAPMSFLMICRLMGDKGVREYINAAARLRAEFPEVECRLAGWIDSNPDSISQAELDRWRKDGTIRFLGRLDDVRPAIREAGVYVLPSYREGTPRTVLEAMSMGRPIVTTDAPGCRETVVDGSNGFLVPVGSSAALQTAMRKFVVEPRIAREMGNRSREIAAEKYDVNEVNEAMLRGMGMLARAPKCRLRGERISSEESSPP